MVDSFTHFIKGKLIDNKKADTIISALMDSWCMSVGFPTTGFFADNRGEFANIKHEKITSKLGLMVRFGPTYSPWSNGLNEKKTSSVDVTMEKMIEDMKMLLTDALVKAPAWTHNTSVNKLGFLPLQIVLGKAVILSGLMTRNEASKSMTDSEAVKRTMETLMKTISEF